VEDPVLSSENDGNIRLHFYAGKCVQYRKKEEPGCEIDILFALVVPADQKVDDKIDDDDKQTVGHGYTVEEQIEVVIDQVCAEETVRGYEQRPDEHVVDDLIAHDATGAFHAEFCSLQELFRVDQQAKYAYELKSCLSKRKK